jgi:hypothetical protein
MSTSQLEQFAAVLKAHGAFAGLLSLDQRPAKSNRTADACAAVVVKPGPWLIKIPADLCVGTWNRLAIVHASNSGLMKLSIIVLFQAHPTPITFRLSHGTSHNQESELTRKVARCSGRLSRS